MAKTLIDRFWDKVEGSAMGCWNWKGAITNHGYGAFDYYGKTAPAHRVAYELYYGEIPSGLHIDHVCSNRKCVNPKHLELVTASENLRREYNRKGLKNHKNNAMTKRNKEGSNRKLHVSQKQLEQRKKAAAASVKSKKRDAAYYSRLGRQGWEGMVKKLAIAER